MSTNAARAESRGTTDQLYGDALTVFEPAPPVDAPHGRLLMAGHQRLPSTDPASPPSRILPPGHPLGNTFSVGPDARRELRDAAAEAMSPVRVSGPCGAWRRRMGKRAGARILAGLSALPVQGRLPPSLSTMSETPSASLY